MRNSWIGLLVALSCSASAQSIAGLWLVEKVMVGDREMTPIAKWFSFDSQGGFTGGNGWLQHSAGNYVYLHDSLWTEDSLASGVSFGAFALRLEEERLFMGRMEEGMQVQVQMKRIEQRSQAYWDQLVGRWTWGEDQIFLRWDREYRIFKKDGTREFGTWHPHAHRKELRLIPWEGEKRFLKVRNLTRDRLLLEEEGQTFDLNSFTAP